MRFKDVGRQTTIEEQGLLLGNLTNYGVMVLDIKTVQPFK
jgi:hypothetical protein